MKKDILSGVAAGLLVSLGGVVFLSCDSRYVGAALFSVALLSICYRGYALFTGRVGFLPESGDRRSDLSTLLLALLGNFIGAAACGLLIRLALPAVGEAALTACTNRLGQPLYSTLIRGFFCGILMYLAVVIYRENKTAVGVVFCIPVFILSGFEHSIADMFYFAASGIVSFRAFLFIWVVIVGNSLGGMFLPWLKLIGNNRSA